MKSCLYETSGSLVEVFNCLFCSEGTSTPIQHLSISAGNILPNIVSQTDPTIIPSASNNVGCMILNRHVECVVQELFYNKVQ